ncbi:MAG: extracellular solute-binding protein [Agathobacter sp.]|nr:extracellular solute-binding protein [Agathobacter sp.]
MKKKALSLLLVSAMAATMFAGCGEKPAEDNAQTPAGTEAPAGDAVSEETEEVKLISDDPNGINIWVADNAVDFTQKLADQYLADNGITTYKAYVFAVGEGDAAGKMITDVQGGADIYGFAQDQLARLVAAQAIMPVTPDSQAIVAETNDAGAVKAATIGDTLYARPMTADNGYFMYYDKNVVTNPEDLSAVLTDCEKAGKTFNMEINSGWYQPSFFFGNGCELTYETDTTGKFTACNVSYANEKGVAALKAMMEVANSSAFVNGSSVGKASNAAVVISGTWDVADAQKMFGDGFACSKLPSYTTADGTKVQLAGFSGYKFIGVKPQTDADKLAAVVGLADYLTSGDVQVQRYEALGWGPSNLEAAQNEKVQADVALTALREQLPYMVPQGQYPGQYWEEASKGLGDDVIAHKLDGKTDEELLAVLQEFETKCNSYLD